MFRSQHRQHREQRRVSKAASLPPEDVEKAFAKEVYGALLARHGVAANIPEEEVAAAKMLCKVDAEYERTLLATPRRNVRSPTTQQYSPSAPRSSSKRSRGGKAVVRSVVRAYIKDRPASSQNAGFAQQDSYNLRRVLTEIQLRMPALKRLQQQHNIDLDTEAGQARSFSDVFAMLDEDGSGDVSLEEFIAFGRRVGGECSRVFNTKLFLRIDIHSQGEVTKDDFIAVLFPKFAQQKRKKELAEQQLLAKKKEIAKWQDDWHPEHLETVETIFGSCDTDRDGLVCLADICRVYKVKPSDMWVGGKHSVIEDFLSVAPAAAASLSLKEFAVLMRPTFSNAPLAEVAEITEFYYEGDRW